MKAKNYLEAVKILMLSPCYLLMTTIERFSAVKELAELLMLSDTTNITYEV